MSTEEREAWHLRDQLRAKRKREARSREEAALGVNEGDAQQKEAMERQLQRQNLITTVKKCTEELFAAKDYATMESLPRQWRKTLSAEVQREIVAELLGCVSSSRSLQLDSPESVAILPRVPFDPNKTLPDSFWKEKTLVYEDILTEGGRSIWAIQKLLLITPEPPFGWRAWPKPLSPSPVSSLCQRIIRVMAMPEWARLETLPPAERVRLASSPDADPFLLRELARAPEVEVRLAVARNLRTTLRTIKNVLINDPNEEVRDAAIKNSYHARSIVPQIDE